MRNLETAASTDKANVELTEQELDKVAGTGIYMNWGGGIEAKRRPWIGATGLN